MTRLRNGQTFPTLNLPRVGGGSLSLPEELAGGFGVVLIYRGAWCPYCNAQLSAFVHASSEFEAVGISVAALSVDDEETTAELVRKRKINFPVAHSADVQAVAEAVGAYVNDEPRYLQSTGFVLDPEGKVLTAVYSSGAIGRLLPDDVVGLVTFLRQHAEATA